MARSKSKVYSHEETELQPARTKLNLEWKPHPDILSGRKKSIHKKPAKMPAATNSVPLYNKDDKVLCFHGEFLYEAKVLDMKLSDSNDKKSPYLYLVHYKGWKNTWDDWVSNDRIRKPTEENKELARTLRRDFDAANKKPSKSAAGTKRRAGGGGDDDDADEDRQNSLGAPGRKGRGRDDLDKEEAFLSRPEIRIPTPDALKAILVDDWEQVTKNQSLVVLPSANPVNKILKDYFEEERLKRREGSAEADILEEAVMGVEDYFKTSLSRILLYTFEREQLNEVRHLWEGKEGKGPGDVYGGEHLLRLIVKLPELIAQTNMDQQSVQHLREEMIKLTSWIGHHLQTYFTASYEPATKAYIEKARKG